MLISEALIRVTINDFWATRNVNKESYEKKSGQANLALFLYFFTEKVGYVYKNLFSLIVMKSICIDVT